MAGHEIACIHIALSIFASRPENDRQLADSVSFTRAISRECWLSDFGGVREGISLRGSIGCDRGGSSLDSALYFDLILHENDMGDGTSLMFIGAACKFSHTDKLEDRSNRRCNSAFYFLEIEN